MRDRVAEPVARFEHFPDRLRHLGQLQPFCYIDLAAAHLSLPRLRRRGQQLVQKLFATEMAFQNGQHPLIEFPDPFDHFSVGFLESPIVTPHDASPSPSPEAWHYFSRQFSLAVGTLCQSLSRRSAALSALEKEGHGCIYNDAETLAKQVRLVPRTEGFNAFVKEAME
jgi:hypothetical protein